MALLPADLLAAGSGYGHSGYGCYCPKNDGGSGGIGDLGNLALLAGIAGAAFVIYQAITMGRRRRRKREDLPEFPVVPDSSSEIAWRFLQSGTDYFSGYKILGKAFQNQNI